MLDQLIKLVQQNGGDAIMNNASIPNQQKSAVVNEVAQQISGSLQAQAKQGNVQQIVSMFSGGGSSSVTSNPVVSQIISSVTSSLSSKFGISPQVSQQIASSILPTIMSQFVNKTNDPNDRDFDLQDMLKNFTGNSSIGDLLGKATGGDTAKAEGLGSTLGKMFN